MCNISRDVMGKYALCKCEKKNQISCAATTHLLSAFVLSHRLDNLSTPKIRNCKHPAIFCCTARFVSDLAGISEDRYSRDAAQMQLHMKSHTNICCIRSNLLMHIQTR